MMDVNKDLVIIKVVLQGWQFTVVARVIGATGLASVVKWSLNISSFLFNIIMTIDQSWVHRHSVGFHPFLWKYPVIRVFRFPLEVIAICPYNYWRILLHCGCLAKLNTKRLISPFFKSDLSRQWFDEVQRFSWNSFLHSSSSRSSSRFSSLRTLNNR